MKLAGRMNRLGTETAFEVLARARALEAKGKQVIHLEIGEPDFDTPENVVRAGIDALASGATHYTAAAGVADLREAIAHDMGERRGVRFSSDNVVVTPGAKPIMFYVMLALLEEGDSVAYPDPGFPIYESMVDFMGARRIPIGFSSQGDRSVWNVHDLINRVDQSTRLIILNSPSNPTGAVLTSRDIDEIAKVAVEVDAVVLADEIYSRILYDVKYESVITRPGMSERTVLLDGFSKTYAMTGWRLGYGIMPSELSAAVTQLMINSNSCTAAFTQIAGVEALKGPQDSPAQMVKEFRRRRDLIVAGLRRISGVTCTIPEGAFYVFPDISGTGLTSRQAADLLLEEYGVAVLSGTAFGSNGEGHLRLSYANSYENLEEALVRIETAFSRIPAAV